ncbi:MAG: NCS1 family nucleobase:cation symporter-1 [Chlamydiales bacterium]|jgi:NCS1 family nucleobase:cation symporter-1
MNVDSSLYNEDLAPVPPEKRTWNMWNYAALWVGMAVCIPSYMLAASLMESGMHWWQALLTIALGNCIVLIPMLLNAHVGTKYGIPFPVFLRSTFGIYGANIPAVMRGLVACGWFGIQTWIGGQAINKLLSIILESFNIAVPFNQSALPILGITGFEFFSFMLFWAMNIYVILKGMDSIKWLEIWAAPLLLIMGLALLVWGVSTAGGFGVIFSEEAVNAVRGNSKDFNFWKIFFPSLTGMVGFWSTVSLNIPDFTRFARSQKDQIIGQAISLPATMTLFSFIGIAVTASTVVIFGEAIWDPVALLDKFESPVVVGIALIGLLLATLSTNIAANVVSPANDFSNLKPDKISFKMGGLLTGILGIVIMPWRLMSDLGAFIFTWLIGYSALLGAIGGTMIADYFFIRRRVLHVEELYKINGEYSYNAHGINWRALSAVFAGILPNIPGFLHAASDGAIAASPFFQELYTYAWFVSFTLSGSIHLLLHWIFVSSKEAEIEEVPVQLTSDKPTTMQRRP